MLLITFFLFLQFHPYFLFNVSLSQCQSSCVVARLCRARVLMCGKTSGNLETLEKVNCTKKNQFVMIDSESPSIIDFIHPMTFYVLFNESMKSLLVGFGVKRITRYMFSEIPDNTGLTIFLNGRFINHIDSFAFEEKKVTPVFYSNPKMGRFTIREYEKAVLTKKTYCDSSSNTCLCKESFNMNNTDIPTYSWHFTESYGFCKNNYVKNCDDPLCKVPSRAEYTTNLLDSSKRKIIPDDYCLRSSTYKLLNVNFFLISLSFLFPACAG